MREPATPFAIRRILVALDASPHSIAALEMAANLAATMEAEIAGLFVEDVQLLRMADAPSAREIAYPGAAVPASRSSMECKLRARSEQIRSTVAAAADRTKVPWSFRTVRGQVTAALRAAMSQHDMIALGRLGWSFGPRLRIGSTALELVTSGVPLLLASPGVALDRLRLLVHYDGTAASGKALQVAAKLAGAGAKGVTVLIQSADYNQDLADARRLLEGQGLDVRCAPIDPDGTTSLLHAVKEESSVLLVLAGGQLLNDRRALETLLRELEVPLLLLGDGFECGETEPLS